MKVIKNKLCFIFVLAATLVSCQMQIVDSDFIASKDALQGCYRFEAVFSEEGALYETFIAMRLNTTRITDSIIPLDICLNDGKGNVYVERCDMPLFKATDDVRIVGAKSKFTDFQWPYRAGIRGANDSTRWSVTIEPTDRKFRDKILGIGFFYKKME